MNRKLVRFLIFAGVFYLAWYLLYQFWISPHTQVDYKIAQSLSYFAVAFLEWMGFTPMPHEESFHVVIGLADSMSAGVWIGNECNGLTLFAVFTTFIIAFPAAHKSKIWYIPLGLVIIHFLNVFRIIGLLLVDHYHRDWLDFNHTYTFTIVMYIFIFLLWYFWISKFALKEISGKKE